MTYAYNQRKQAEEYEDSFEFVPSVDQKPGNDTLMISIMILFLKAIKIRII
jgi:hypothetical protein